MISRFVKFLLGWDDESSSDDELSSDDEPSPKTTKRANNSGTSTTLKKIDRVTKHLNLLHDSRRFELAYRRDELLEQINQRKEQIRAAHLEQINQRKELIHSARQLQLRTYKRQNSKLSSHPTNLNLAAIAAEPDSPYDGIHILFKSIKRVSFSLTPEVRHFNSNEKIKVPKNTVTHPRQKKYRRI